MLLKKKVMGRSLGIPVGLAIGAVVSLLITIGAAALFAWLLSAEKIGEGAVESLRMLTHCISAIAGSIVSYILVKRMRLQVCLISGVCYYILLIGMTALFFGGQYSALGISALIILVSSGAVAFWPAKNKAKWKIRKKGYR
jgi:hypothetical protein